MSNGAHGVVHIPEIPDWNRLLEGRVAVITGGGDGIGAGIATLFAAHGAAVEVAEIDPARAERINDEVTAAGGVIRSHVVDVTGDDVEDPVAIADLRPVRWQQNLHHAGTLRNDPVALAVRIETLIVTSHGQAIRPPRKIVAGLAAFLLDLAPTTPLPTDTPGAAVFARECATCHRGDGASGPAVPLVVVGTDPLVGQSADRGTGSYRVPSLRAVGDRRRMFASGAIEDIEDLLKPSTAREAKGHAYGLALEPDDRAALLDYLRAL